jgi:hypothetical protein
MIDLIGTKVGIIEDKTLGILLYFALNQHLKIP